MGSQLLLVREAGRLCSFLFRGWRERGRLIHSLRLPSGEKRTDFKKKNVYIDQFMENQFSAACMQVRQWSTALTRYEILT